MQLPNDRIGPVSEFFSFSSRSEIAAYNFLDEYMPPQSAAATASPNRQNNPGVVHLPPYQETGASGHSGSPVSRPDELRQWWNTLSNRRPTTKYFDADRVKPNASEILCPDNAAKIRINNTTAAVDDGKPIHASKFIIAGQASESSTPVAAHSTNTYAIGQSPHQETFEDFLIASLESKLGLYQFVSESTHNGKKAEPSPLSSIFWKNE